MFLGGSDAAPGPVFRLVRQASRDGVRKDVGEGGLKVGFVADDPGRESFREECAAAAVPGVVLPGVVALQPLEGT